ncbi:hypothetical protein ACIBEJ_45895 [Nonomuraea sp. NPDC050790]|uniref:hypothetical protein n=1 Tax=Nonomuraea sp. NPDC050790 TaxID=3364371 RepID=UPI0037A014C6
MPATSAGRVLISDWEPDAVRDWFTPERPASAGAVRPAGTDALLEELDFAGRITAKIAGELSTRLSNP